MNPTDPRDLQHALGSGRYLLGRVLGRRATATVYLARDFMYPHLVTVKVMPASLAQSRAIERAATLRHAHILPLYDWGTIGDHLFYTAPFADGGSVFEHAASRTQFRRGDAMRMARDIARALAYLHAHAVMHGRVHGGNLVVLHGRAMLCDVATGAAPGTRSSHDVGQLQAVLLELVRGIRNPAIGATGLVSLLRRPVRGTRAAERLAARLDRILLDHMERERGPAGVETERWGRTLVPGLSPSHSRAPAA